MDHEAGLDPAAAEEEVNPNPNTMDYGPIPMRAGEPKNHLLQLLAVAGIYGIGAPIPPEERVLLTDISAWNGDINFDTMRNAGADGTRMRATGTYLNMGQCFTDAKFAANRSMATDTAFPFGCYHFLSNTLGGTAQAQYFLEATSAGRGDLPCAVDVELTNISATKIKVYAETIYNALSYYPDVYTSSYYWSKVTGTTDKTWITQHCQLWVAHWGTLTPLLPAGWSDYTCHQFSANGNGRAAEYGSTNGDPDMDLDYCRRAWFTTYVHPPSWEWQVTYSLRSLGFIICDPPG